MGHDEHPEVQAFGARIEKLARLAHDRPPEALAELVEFAQELQDDERLGFLCEPIEILVDVKWYAVGPAFEAALHTSRGLRQAMEYTVLNNEVLHDRIVAIVHEVGGQED